jgi:hypothetical protein
MFGSLDKMANLIRNDMANIICDKDIITHILLYFVNINPKLTRHSEVLKNLDDIVMYLVLMFKKYT